MDELRYEPTEKLVSARLGGERVVATTRAVLVWEPRRVLPSYAVPADELRAELMSAPAVHDVPRGDEILHGGFAFGVHSSDGEALDVRAGAETRVDAAFRSSDPDLAPYVVLDFHAFDAWYEEDERIVAHPRDPYHRVDIRRGSRHVRVELDGTLLAESTRPHLVFETSLATRFYVPREDVVRPLAATDHHTRCAYKGEAAFVSLELDGGARSDLAWTYVRPLPEAAELEGLVAFFDEKADVIVDGSLQALPRTGVAATIVAESEA